MGSSHKQEDKHHPFNYIVSELRYWNELLAGRSKSKYLTSHHLAILYRLDQELKEI